MSDLSPSQFETPGNPADTLPEISATQSPSGSGGRAETANNEGESILGAEERVLADEAGEGPLVVRLATAGHPTSGTWPAGTTVIDKDGVAWNTAAGGTPGTWAQAFDAAGAASQAQASSVQVSLQPNDAPGLGLFFPEAHGFVSGQPADDAIVAAATAAAAVGGTVWLSQAYQVDSLVISDLNNVTFRGVGFASITGTVSSNPVMSITGCTNITVENVALSHASRQGDNTGHGISVTGSTNVRVDGNSLSNINWVAVYFGNDNIRCSAINNLITNAEGGVFIGQNNDQIKVSDNFIWGVDDDAIAFVGYDTGTSPITRINCTGNVIWEGKSRGIAAFGVSGGVIADNTISTTTNSGIMVGNDVSYGTYGASALDVSGNIIIDANTYNSPGSAQPSILVVGNDANHIVSNCHLTANHTVGGPNQGIRVIATVSGGVSSISILGNRVDTCGTNGIEVIADVTNADVGGNSIYHPNQTNTTGIYGVMNASPAGHTGQNFVTPDPDMTALAADVYSVDGMPGGAGALVAYDSTTSNLVTTSPSTSSTSQTEVTGTLSITLPDDGSTCKVTLSATAMLCASQQSFGVGIGTSPTAILKYTTISPAGTAVDPLHVERYVTAAGQTINCYCFAASSGTVTIEASSISPAELAAVRV